MRFERFGRLRRRGGVIAPLVGLLFVLGCAAAGAYAGLRMAGRPLRAYHSVGVVRIANTVPEGLDREQTRPMFAAFMDTQRALIGSQRVADMAAQDPAWQA